MILSLFLAMAASSAQGATPLVKASEWPIYPQTLFLKGGVNAVASGSTLMFWALGDTVSFIDKATLTQRSELVVRTGTAIQDLLYDEVNERLYIAAGYDTDDQSGGVQIVDVSDPDNPVVTVIFDQAPDNPGSYIDFIKNKETPVDQPHIDARGLGLHGTTLFVADDNFGLRVLDVSTYPNPPVEVPLTTQTEERISGYKQPNIVGSYDATGGYVALEVYPFGGKVYAFVLDFYSGIKVFDVTTPAVIGEPTLKPTLSQLWYGSISLISDIFVTETGGRLSAYVTGTNADRTESVISRMDVDVTDPMTITNFGVYESEDEARSVSVSGDYAYLACGSAGLKIVDISAVPAAGQVLDYPLEGSYDTNVDGTYHAFLEGTNVYLASAQSGLKLLDVTDPIAPAAPNPAVADLPFPLNVNDVCFKDDHTYLLDRNRGLRIIENQDPSYMVLESYLALSGVSTDLAVSGNYAFVAQNSGTVRVIDIADPDQPVVAGAIALADPRDLFIDGTTLYAAAGSEGVHRVTIADPLNPVVLTALPTAGDAEAAYVHDDRAYVAQGADGLSIFDLSAPASPVLLATVTATDACDVTLLDQGASVFALIADGASGFMIQDVTDPTGVLPPPTRVQTLDGGGALTAQSVAVYDNTAFVGLGTDGFVAFDLTDPSAPVQISYRDTAASVSDIVPRLYEGTVYLTLAEASAGMQIFYLYASSGNDDDPPNLVPSIDSGCFIDTVKRHETTGITRILSRIVPLLSFWSPGL
ncbi:hypothetical protein JCM14469_00130 [Desulfatiferula olefinivorans]